MSRLHMAIQGCLADRRSRRGSTVLVLALLMLVAFAIASYTINVVYMEFARTELQITADVCTRAACRAQVDTGDRSRALRAAQRLADANPVRGQVITIANGDLHFMVATRYEEQDGYDYSTRLANPNSVRLNAEFFQRSESGLGLLFPSLGVPIVFRPLKEATATQSELDLAIVLDRSSSMGYSSRRRSMTENLVELPLIRTLPSDTRFRDAEAGILEVLDLFETSPQQEFVSLSTFDTLAVGDVPLSPDPAPIRSKLATYGQSFRGGMSSLADGIRNGLDMLSDDNYARPWASRILLLISDGKRNFGADPRDMARVASQEYVMIYTVSLSEEADQSLMAEIAELTHGKHFHATNAAQFRTIMQEISRRLPILITR